ncbi:MmcQ/YjbR family DNA-binding protein [Actinocorallia longicatena]|uniref:MmcQ/YjbR family DNA-binding protein n=1 Tax=Actinocorallia longicatena TaxID=111803 RepID=A0ABP6QDV1_9ACTN
MTPADLKAVCLGLTGAVEEFPFGEETSVFKVAGKMFALSRLDAIPLTVNLKCEPELARALRAEHPEIVPGYHMNKRHWNTVTADGALPDTMVTDLIEDSYELIRAALTRSQRATLASLEDH